MIYMKFDPTTGLAFTPGDDCDHEAFRKRRDDKWLYNPWTGWYRSADDINRDPQGRSIDPYCLTCGGTNNHKPGCPDAPKVSTGQHWRNHATGIFCRVVSVKDGRVLLEYKDGPRRLVEIAKLHTHWALVPDRYLTDCAKAELAPVKILKDMDEDDPRWALNSTIEDLLEGIGAREDHELVQKAWRDLGLADDIALRLHTKVCMRDDQTRLRGLRGTQLLAAETTLHQLGYTCTVDGGWQPPTTKPAAVSAPDLLDAAAGHMRDRAKTYDKPEGERSMAQTVVAFNAITGRTLTESEGWLLMQILKDVRDRARQDAHRDSLEDGIAYSALKAEARLAGK